MLVNLYKSKSPLSVFALPLVTGLLGLHLFFEPKNDHAYFFEWQALFFGSVAEMVWLNYLLSWGLSSLNAGLLNYVFNRNAFYSKDTFLPGFIYLIGLVTFRSIHFSPLLLSHLFLIGALAGLLQLKRQEPAKDIIFRSSALIALAVVFSPLSVSLIFLPWTGLLLIKPFNWREWAIAIPGMIIPMLYYYAIAYLVTGELRYPELPVRLDDPSVTWTIPEGALYLVAGFSLLVGLFKFLAIMRGQIVSFKKLSQLVLFTAAFSLASWIIGWYLFSQPNLAFLLPFSFIVGVQLLNARRVQLANGLIMLWFLIGAVNLFL